MAKKGENIYQRKDGRWEGRCVLGRKADGKYVYRYVYARSYQEVRDKLIVEKSRNMDLLKPPAETAVGDQEMPEDKETLFCSLAQDWLAAKRLQIKESTYIKYRNMVNAYILPELGGLAWDSLSRETIERFCLKMLTSGGRQKKGLSAKTVSDILSAVSGIFRYASYHGYRLTFDLSAMPVKKETKKMRILSRNEQEKLCRFLRFEPSGKDLGLLICLFAGLRLGEICALRWEDISLSEQTIHVHRTMQRIQNGDYAGRFDKCKGQVEEGMAKTQDSKCSGEKMWVGGGSGKKATVGEASGKKTRIIITEPKSSDSIRIIPIPGELVRLLWFYGKGKKGYVLTGREDTFVEPRAMERHFERTLQKAGMEKVNFHALRHTFATRCVEMDFDVKSLSEILGHSNVSITLGRYVHPSMELKRKNMQRLEELLAVS